jgi:DNA-binding PadR family transcriptional regulator
MSYPAAEILTHLVELAAAEAGFELRGVHGWTSAGAIVENTGIWGAAGLLKTLLRNGHVLQEDVRAPGMARAAHVYRISQHGVETLAAVVCTWAAGIRLPNPCTEERVLLRDGVLAALEILKSATGPASEPNSASDAGQLAWSSARRLSRLLEQEDEARDGPPRWFTSDDLAWLVRHGFAEERVCRKTHRYRITPAGAALRPLHWRC